MAAAGANGKSPAAASPLNPAEIGFRNRFQQATVSYKGGAVNTFAALKRLSSRRACSPQKTRRLRGFPMLIP